MSIIDSLIVLVCLAAVFGIGMYFSRNQKTTEDFFLAGKNVPGWVVVFYRRMIKMSIYDYLETRFSYVAWRMARRPSSSAASRT